MTEWEAGETLRITQSLTRQAAIDLVANDPSALNAVLRRAELLITSPLHRATDWREVTNTISALAALIPDDIEWGIRATAVIRNTHPACLLWCDHVPAQADGGVGV